MMYTFRPQGNGGDCPRDKLVVGRRPVRNWTRRTIPSLFLCRKLHLFLGKSTKTAATRAALFDSNMHQIVCRFVFRGGATSNRKGIEKKGRGEGREFVLCPRKEVGANGSLTQLVAGLRRPSS